MWKNYFISTFLFDDNQGVNPAAFLMQPLTYLADIVTFTLSIDKLTIDYFLTYSFNYGDIVL